MKKQRHSVIDIDFDNNVVFLSNGDICEVESYADINDEPCEGDEARLIYYISNYNILKYELTDYDIETYWGIYLNGEE